MLITKEPYNLAFWHWVDEQFNGHDNFLKFANDNYDYESKALPLDLLLMKLVTCPNTNWMMFPTVHKSKLKRFWRWLIGPPENEFYFYGKHHLEIEDLDQIVISFYKFSQ